MLYFCNFSFMVVILFCLSVLNAACKSNGAFTIASVIQSSFQNSLSFLENDNFSNRYALKRKLIKFLAR